MRKSILFILISISALMSVFSAGPEMPDDINFKIAFTKSGVSSFGVFEDSDCTNELTAIDFPIQKSVSDVATRSFYIVWDLYGDYDSNVKVEILLSDGLSTYASDLADPTNKGYCLSFTDSTGKIISGLNYSVSATTIASVSTDLDDSPLVITGSDIYNPISAEKRKYSFFLKNSTEKATHIKGEKQVTLTINPPQYVATGEASFMSVAYSGIISILLKVEE